MSAKGVDNGKTQEANREMGVIGERSLRQCLLAR